VAVLHELHLTFVSGWLKTDCEIAKQQTLDFAQPKPAFSFNSQMCQGISGRERRLISGDVVQNQRQESIRDKDSSQT